MEIVIVGTDLPGRTSTSDGITVANVHVGIQERRDPVGLVAGDADGAEWRCDVGVVRTDDGNLDFRGPHVQGTRGDRFIYLVWVDLLPNGHVVMFRRAKLMLNRVDPALVVAAGDDGTLVATVRLTDERGGPRCARVDPPAIAWTAEAASGG